LWTPADHRIGEVGRSIDTGKTCRRDALTLRMAQRELCRSPAR
jgi:hypothetical protein